MCYSAGILRKDCDCDLPSLASAVMVAEALIDVENDCFYDVVRFYESQEGKNHQLVYRIERNYEPTDTLES